MAPIAGHKRKVDYNPPGTAAQARKRQKGKDARAIPSQTADAALSTSGELNIASFIKAREFEIAALDQSVKKARKGLSQRAFQQVPRHMRRRTASHNVKKIPKRLRARAGREMNEDNTPTASAQKRKPSKNLRLRMETFKKLKKLNENRKTKRQKKREAKVNPNEPDSEKQVSIARIPRIKKNQLAGPPQSTSKFKRRQLNKTWLPTHLWHTKRAHMTRPTMPLWRMAIPLKPTEKSYRPTHRAASSRGCVAWDTSYMSTVGCQGTEAALEGMLKALGFAGEGWSGSKYKKWNAGSRFAEGWVHERDNLKKSIAPILVLWQVKDEMAHGSTTDVMEIDNEDISGQSKAASRKTTRLDRKLFTRLHPSAFHQFWQELMKVAKMQKPQVLLEDLRFEIGSIDIKGPNATEALIGTLRLAHNQQELHRTWSILAALNNPSTLPQNAMLVVNTLDPRLNHPPRQIPVARDAESMNKLNELIVSWPSDKNNTPSKVFNHKERYRVSKSLPSQKKINRRRQDLLPSQQLEPSDKDPEIPAVLLAHRSPNKDTNNQGSWTVLLPWSCVDPIWRSLMYYPLSSGSTPRFGGLEQTQQLAFENAVPWFPADCPGTEAGKAWERTESERRCDEWIRRPPSKRYSWEALDLGLGRKGELGRGWACDWEYLFRDTDRVVPDSTRSAKGSMANSTARTQLLLTQRQRKAAAAEAEKEREMQARRRNTSSPESGDEQDQLQNDVKFTQLDPAQASRVFDRFATSSLTNGPALATIRITLLTRGTPKPTARIYRLPQVRPPRVTSNEHNNDVSRDVPQADLAAGSSAVPASAPQFTPLLFDETPKKSSDQSTSQNLLRQRWLNLDPEPRGPNFSSSTHLPKPLLKIPENRHGDPTTHRTYQAAHTRNLSHIRVFPPHERKPQVLNMFGPRPPKKTPEEMLKVLQPQLVPNIVVNAEGELVEEGLWHKHVPCPDEGDLIGFVTSGGYNLARGCGTAVGAVWAQRVGGGWMEEEMGSGPGESGTGESKVSVIQPGIQATKVGSRRKAKAAKSGTNMDKEEKQQLERIDRERHLCVVRNAGESVGRLAIWEVC